MTVIALSTASLGLAPSARALPSVTVSGTVTLPEGAPSEYLNAVTVWIHGPGGHADSAAVSPADGTYVFTAIAAETYKVEFRVGSYVPEGGGSVTPALVDEFYNNAYAIGAATAVIVGTSNVTGIDATLEWAGSISGTVTFEGDQPADTYKGVRVNVSGPRGASGGDLNLAADGSYSIGGLAPGDYVVQFLRQSYWNGSEVVAPTFMEEVYNDVYGVTGSQPVTVVGSATTSGIDAGLNPAGHFTTLGTPSITVGSLALYSVLGSSTGSWQPSATAFTYQWKRDGVPVAGATDSTYELTLDDQDSTLTLTVTATRSSFTSAARTSAPLVLQKFFTAAPMPSISGTAKAGSKLTASRGTWSPAPSAFTYQWLRNGAAITGATASTYTLKTLDRGAKITVLVTASRAGYTTSPRTSPYLYIPKVFTKTPTPTITGTARAGSTLTAHRGTWSPTPTYSYRWLRNGVPIAGATSYKYKLTTKDKGKTISVRVYAKKSLYLTTYKTSAAKTIAR